MRKKEAQYSSCFGFVKRNTSVSLKTRDRWATFSRFYIYSLANIVGERRNGASHGAYNSERVSIPWRPPCRSRLTGSACVEPETKDLRVDTGAAPFLIVGVVRPTNKARHGSAIGEEDASAALELIIITRDNPRRERNKEGGGICTLLEFSLIHREILERKVTTIVATIRTRSMQRSCTKMSDVVRVIVSGLDHTGESLKERKAWRR